MIQWLVIKEFFAKMRDFIKKYWQFFAGITVSVLGMIAFRNRSDGLDVLANEKESNQREAEAIKKSEEILKNKSKDALYLYEKTVREVEKKFKEDNKALSEDTKKKVRRIIEDTKEDPTELTSRISKLTGYEIYVEED